MAATNTTAVPNPATPTVGTSVCRTMTSTSKVLMPNAIRCTASPASVAATGGTAHTVRAPRSQPLATARTAEPWSVRTVSSGPSTRAGNLSASSRARVTGTATMKMMAAEPVSPAPISQRGTSMKLAPANAANAPAAIATEFIDTT